MKTGKRSYPLDMLSVSEDGVSVSIHTHRSQIVVSVTNKDEEFRVQLSFDEFQDAMIGMVLENIKGEIYSPASPSVVRTPSMMKGSR